MTAFPQPILDVKIVLEKEAECRHASTLANLTPARRNELKVQAMKRERQEKLSGVISCLFAAFGRSTKEMLALQSNRLIGTRRPRGKDLLRNGLDLVPIAIELIGDLEWHYFPAVQIADNRKNDSETNWKAVVEHLEVEHATVNVDLGISDPQ